MKIEAVRADRGGEYLSNEFQYFLNEIQQMKDSLSKAFKMKDMG